MPHFMIVLIPSINLTNLSLINKCLFLREAQSDQGLHCLHTEPLDTTECVNGAKRPDITKTCLFNSDTLEPHLYTVKLGFTGVYIIFLISAQNIDCGYSLEPPPRGGSNEYPQFMF